MTHVRTPAKAYDSAGKHINHIDPDNNGVNPHDLVGEPRKLLCRECGEDMWISDAGTAHHWGCFTIDDICHELDADHTPVPDTDEIGLA